MHDLFVASPDRFTLTERTVVSINDGQYPLVLGPGDYSAELDGIVIHRPGRRGSHVIINDERRARYRIPRFYQ